ncbi:DUF3775 domain-containing protein [Halorhodospira neutriphila]|uniref:DUF3775 domain-containing protein n=1 Tax=Halorhodospira neutriphila TaxID=168379 RepID=A0ABS1E5N4_9GAMM|nr:DUF3775 domain-containing protein [Halorhodospira neutriphila]MBK1726833.1 hypothetical protein [Halorhodospira neutriphila]
MLEVSLVTICFIIQKCREFQAKEEVVIPGGVDGSDEDWVAQVLADHADDWTVQEVRSAFDDLEPASQAQIVTLMWIGRGDFDASEWAEAEAEARAAWRPRTADYILATPLAADYLEYGLEALGLACDE